MKSLQSNGLRKLMDQSVKDFTKLRKLEPMSNDLNKAQAKMVAEKTAILANTAFKLGLETEGKRILDILNAELVLHKPGSSGAGTVQRIIYLITGQAHDESN